MIDDLVKSPHLRAHRRVLLMDTCHAGKLLPGVRGVAAGTAYSQEEANQQLADPDAAGLYIVAASSERGLAQERDGHGLFTAAVLEGLEGGADETGNGNGFVEINELCTFVRDRVHVLSEGRQRMTVPEVVGGEEFALARIMKN